MAWKPFKTAPKDGTLVIFWMSSEKGFEDTTANFYYHARTWYWECDDSPLKRPDLVNGWMRYPQPPKNPMKLPAFKDSRTLRDRR